MSFESVKNDKMKQQSTHNNTTKRDNIISITVQNYVNHGYLIDEIENLGFPLFELIRFISYNNGTC